MTKIASLLLFTLTAPIYAQQHEDKVIDKYVESWSQEGPHPKTRTRIFYGFNEMSTFRVEAMNTTIESANDGIQRIYFHPISFTTHIKQGTPKEEQGEAFVNGKHAFDTCDREEDEPEYTVWKFSTDNMLSTSQNIKMTLYCDTNEEDPNNSKSEYATPSTEEGLEYIVTLFKTSPTNVQIDSVANNVIISIPVSAKNFNNFWNSYGGNAL